MQAVSHFATSSEISGGVVFISCIGFVKGGELHMSSKKKSAQELYQEYLAAEARAQALKEKAKRATQAEEA